MREASAHTYFDQKQQVAIAKPEDWVFHPGDAAKAHLIPGLTSLVDPERKAGFKFSGIITAAQRYGPEIAWVGMNPTILLRAYLVEEPLEKEVLLQKIVLDVQDQPDVKMRLPLQATVINDVPWHWFAYDVRFTLPGRKPQKIKLYSEVHFYLEDGRLLVAETFVREDEVESYRAEYDSVVQSIVVVPRTGSKPAQSAGDSM